MQEIAIVGIIGTLLSVSVGASAATIAEDIKIPADILSIKPGIPVQDLLKLRPRVHPIVPGQDLDIKTASQILTEELDGHGGDVIYSFVDGSLSHVSVGWFPTRRISSTTKAALLSECDKLWGPTRELAVFEYPQDGRKERYAEYRWELGKGWGSLAFLDGGASITASRFDGRLSKRNPGESRLLGDDAQRVISEMDLPTEIPTDALSMELGIPLKALLKRRPSARPMAAPSEVPKGSPLPVTEDLAGPVKGLATYLIVEGSISQVALAWFVPHEQAAQFRDTIVAACDRLWGSNREFGAFEEVFEGRKERFVLYRWPVKSGDRFLKISPGPEVAFSVSKHDSRGNRRPPPKARLSRAEEARLLAELGLPRSDGGRR